MVVRTPISALQLSDCTLLTPEWKVSRRWSRGGRLVTGMCLRLSKDVPLRDIDWRATVLVHSVLPWQRLTSSSDFCPSVSFLLSLDLFLFFFLLAPKRTPARQIAQLWSCLLFIFVCCAHFSLLISVLTLNFNAKQKQVFVSDQGGRDWRTRVFSHLSHLWQTLTKCEQSRKDPLYFHLRSRSFWWSS